MGVCRNVIRVRLQQQRMHWVFALRAGVEFPAKLSGLRIIICGRRPGVIRQACIMRVGALNMGSEFQSILM
jgi:hypothetical protein